MLKVVLKTEEVPSTPAAEDFSETKIHANISVSEKLVKFYWDKVIQRHEMSMSNFTSQFYFDSQEKSCGENILKKQSIKKDY